MTTDSISLNQRITQANARLAYICRQWYLRKMSTENFTAERKDILDFIERASHEDEQALSNQNLAIMPKPKAAKPASAKK